MRYRSITAAAVALIAGAALSAPAYGQDGDGSASPTVVESAPAAVSSAAPVAATPASAPVEFDVGLLPSDLAGAEALAAAVSEPSSSSYGKYLTAAEWETRFSPSQSEVKAVSSWLRSPPTA
jgi:subtilase family serine protease